MAYSRSRSAGRRSGSARRTYSRRAAPRRAAPRRRASARRSAGHQTLKIVIEQAGASSLDLRNLGQKTSPAGKRRAKF